MNHKIAITITALLTLTTCGYNPGPPQEGPDSADPPRSCPKGSTVMVVGDSITVATSAVLTKALKSEGYLSQINAHSGRMVKGAMEPVAGFAEFHDLKRCWVIALGTNDTYHLQPSEWQPELDTLIPLIPKNEPTWWVRVAIANGDNFNALIPYKMIDWNPVADELTDGTHPNDAGKKIWVSLVMNALLS